MPLSLCGMTGQPHSQLQCLTHLPSAKLLHPSIHPSSHPHPSPTLAMSDTLTPAITHILHDLPSLIEHTLKHEAACQTLVAQCTALAAHIDLAKRHVAQDKAAQRVLRAEIAAFLRERGELRSSAVIANSASCAAVTVDEDVSMCSEDNNRSLYQESPLCLKAKRKGRVFDDDMEILPKRRRLAVDDSAPRSKL
ncbi:hypothetical protein BC628DRAFT_1400745 [Trametes gibbosa]|nr:hypothetical protein BC628DRAFT_1400745 [Trametes gibbosa]